MNRILNFVVILLTTLSIVNAVNIPLRKRATAFATCPSGSPQFSAASIVPDPPVAGKTATAQFSIILPITLESGNLAVDATAAGGKSIEGFPNTQDVCTINGIICPIAAGSTVDIQTPVPIPDDVPDTYTLEYSLVDGTGKEIACSSGPVTGAAAAPGGKGPGDGGPDGKGPDDGGPGGKAPPDDGGPDGKAPPDDGKAPPDDGGPGGKAPPDGGDGGDGKAPGGGDGGPAGKGKGGPPGPPDGGDGGPAGKGKGGPPGPPDGGDGGDGDGAAPP